MNELSAFLHLFVFRSPRDDYSSVIGRCSIARDPYPQWRQLAWTADCDMLAYADSRGNVTLFDMFGTLICKIPTVSIALFKVTI